MGNIIGNIKKTNKIYRLEIKPIPLDLPQTTLSKGLKFFNESPFKIFKYTFDTLMTTDSKIAFSSNIFNRQGYRLKDDVWYKIYEDDSITFYTPNKTTSAKIIKKYHKENIKQFKEFIYFVKTIGKHKTSKEELLMKYQTIITTMIRNIAAKNYLSLIR